MLTPEEWNIVGKQAVKIYDELELEIIQEIAERIANFSFANSVVLNNIKIAQEMGLLYEDIVLLVAKYNETSVSQVKKIFENAGVSSLKFDDNIYKMAGLEPLPIKQNETMWKLLEATALKTNLNLNNLVMTTADVARTDFYEQMNNAYMQVITGVKSYSQVINESIKTLSKNGAKIKYPSGQTRSIESAVRMNVLTSVNQTCGKLQEMRAEELGWDLMELTAHSGARPSHAEWQGKIVSLSGKKGYLSKKDIGYGEVDGFKGVNCRHDWFPYYKGSSRTYTNKELNKLKNETVTYNGKKISKYEATQIQRKMERQIRDDKKELAGIQGALKSNNQQLDIKDLKQQETFLNARIYRNKLELQKFNNQTNIKLDISRERIVEKTKINSKKVVNLSQKLYNEENKEIAINKYIQDEVIRTHIREGKVEQYINKSINIDKQNKHILNTKEYTEGRSYLTINLKEAEKIVQQYCGTGRLERDRKGNFKNREIILADKNIGYVLTEDKKILTNMAKIHYSKTGTHIVPFTYKEEE